jgi:hypothetical protein
MFAASTTKILMPFTTTSGLTDVAGGHSITLRGSPTISMTQSRWGNGALYIDSGTSLKINSTATLNLDGLVPFTFEFWVYNTRDTINASFISMRITGYCPLVVMKGWTLKGNSTLTGFTILTLSTPVPLNQWTHVAIVGDGTSIKEYINGVLVIATAHPNWSNGNNFLNIGQDTEDTFVGYMNDFRFSNTAIYTANFTPPTSPF